MHEGEVCQIDVRHVSCGVRNAGDAGGIGLVDTATTSYLGFVCPAFRVLKGRQARQGI